MFGGWLRPCELVTIFRIEKMVTGFNSQKGLFFSPNQSLWTFGIVIPKEEGSW